MRLWSLHPRYLDRKGLVALWREALLARKVLEGRTRGYRNHPQIERFKKYEKPLVAINAYLWWIFEEASKRGYDFDESKVLERPVSKIIPVTFGQLRFEFDLLLEKVRARDSKHFQILKSVEPSQIEPNPLFFVVEGGVENWEKTKLHKSKQPEA